MAAILINAHATQPTDKPLENNQNLLANEVQLSISASNRIIGTGSTITVRCQVKNSSTNLIYWLLPSCNQGFVFTLTNSAGKFYRLTPGLDTNSEVVLFSGLAQKLKAGEKYGCSVPVDIPKEIKPGTYQLAAKLFFYINKSKTEHELLSNLTDVEVHSTRQP